MALYLIHSDVPLPQREGRAARHYLGYADGGVQGAMRRFNQHQEGHSDVRIIREFLSRGATLTLVRVWPDGTHADERRRKRAGRHSDYCPICRTSRDNHSGVSRAKGSYEVSI